MTGEVGRVCLG